MDISPGASQLFTIPGPSGELETLLEVPEMADETSVAVICHPHPLHGGTMTNKVAHMLAKSFNAVGAPALRFNFRGVGRSAGQYADGAGETDDAIAALDWMQARWPQARLWIGGFSFGGAVAIRAATQRNVTRLVTVAPAVDRVDVPTDKLSRVPWLVIQGEADEVVPAQAVNQWLSALPVSPDVVMLPGVGHYFHGRLNELKNEVVGWLKERGDEVIR